MKVIAHETKRCSFVDEFEFRPLSIMWASARVPTDSVPTTQSPKREVGTITLWPQARVCGVRVKERERGWVLIGGWCGCECDGVFHQQLSMLAHPPVPRP